MSDFSHRVNAEKNEQFAESLDGSQAVERGWIVTVRFYSLLHYVEERLTSHGYTSERHNQRMDNIKSCNAVETAVYKKYRALYDISRDARYECVRMNQEDVEESERILDEGKRMLGFDQGGSDYKYEV